jgi:DNA mismatch repair protein MutL
MIKRLSPELIREIAAGEVINAPVDVLKELLENALDAGATRLEVELREGGKTLLRVTDNGLGIPKEELRLAVEAHATSKLESLSHIQTLGFRGEGLYAIRQAAKLNITSRPSPQLGGATVMTRGEDIVFDEHPAPAGTTVVVTELFDTLPARKASLGSDQHETQACVQLLSRYLLHYPQLSIKLNIDEQEKWAYAGGDFEQAAKFLWGAVTSNRLLRIESIQTDMGLQGLLSRPELSRLKKDRLNLSVNGRPVQWPESLLKAVLTAYRELLPAQHYPVGVINLSLAADKVLVNTAPDKQRVKFLDEKNVIAFVQQAIETMLSKHPLAPVLPELSSMESLSGAPRSAFPQLKYLGTYRDLYLLAEADGQLWVIDHHAAHERILFEELAKRFAEEPAVELDHSELISLSEIEASHYLERQEALAQRGLMLEHFGAGRWRVRKVPAFLLGFPALINEVIKGTLNELSLDEAWRMILGRLACLPAIKAGHRLSRVDAQSLLNALRQCETPWACPHGRPTALVLSELELARKFGRKSARAVHVAYKSEG